MKDAQIHFPVTTCNNLTPENLTKTGFHNKIVYIKKVFKIFLINVQ